MQENKMITVKSRDFICSCKKAYLSYAALFTHIKQKHGGKAPGPIVRPRSSNKRGRPRKTKSDSEVRDLQSVFKTQEQKSESSENEDEIEENQEIEDDLKMKKLGDSVKESVIRYGFQIYKREDNEYNNQIQQNHEKNKKQRQFVQRYSDENQRLKNLIKSIQFISTLKINS